MTFTISFTGDDPEAVEVTLSPDDRTVVVHRLRDQHDRPVPVSKVVDDIWLQKVDDYFLAVRFGVGGTTRTSIQDDRYSLDDDCDDVGMFSHRIRFLMWLLWDGNSRWMANDLGVTQGLVSKVVNGRHKSSLKMVDRLAKRTGISRPWLESGKQEE